MEPQSTEALFLAWRTGADLRALAQVFDEIAPELYAVARHLARGTSEAEDLVQETFLAAIERAASYDPARPLRPWLFGILGHAARKLRSRRAPNALEREPAVSTQPLDELIAQELHGAVAQAVAALPPHYASAVALHLEDGLPPREIGARLSISSELARTHLSRGLAWLRRAMPESLSAGAWIGGSGYRDLRARVLASAGGATIAAPTFSVLALAALLLLPLSLAGGGVVWLLSAKEPASISLAVAGEARAAPAQTPVENSAPPAGRERLPGAPADAHARVHGRILLAGGAPAAGTEVRASTFSKDLGSAQCDTRGAFALALDVAKGQYVALRTKLPGYVSAGASYSLFPPGSDTDTGELVLPRAGVLVGQFVDAQSRPLAEGWELMSTADAPQTHPANKRWAFWSRANFDARSGTARLEGLPAGAMKVVARSPLSVEQIQVAVQIVEGAETAAEFRYEGPDLRQRLLLRARPSLQAVDAFRPEASSVRLLGAEDGAPRTAVAPAHRLPGEYLFDGLPEGEYTLEVDDPRFERWTEPRAQPGHAYSAKLEGTAALKLRVLGPDGAPIVRYGLQIAFLDANSRPTTGELPAPADGLVKGLVPVRYTLTLRPEGLPERVLDVPALRRGETRELLVDYRSSVALGGRVADEQGMALPGVDVELTRGEHAGEDWPGTTGVFRDGKTWVVLPIAKRAKTDAQGRFQFDGLERGPWTVRARFSSWLVHDRTFELGSEAPPPVELTRPASGFLAGHVTPAEVALAVDDDPVPAHLHPAQDGSFRAGPLPVGAHSLSAWVALSLRGDGASTEAFQTPIDLGRFEIVAGHDTERTYDIRSQLPARIALVVRAGGTALEQGWVLAMQMDQPGVQGADSITLGAGGRATLGIVQRAPVRLALVARELGWVWTSDEVLSPAAGERLERTLDVPLVKHTLRCLDASTKAPLANQELRWGAKLAGLEAAAHGKTDANGLIELSLPPGKHEFFGGSAAQGAAVDWDRVAGDPIEILLPSAR